MFCLSVTPFSDLFSLHPKILIRSLFPPTQGIYRISGSKARVEKLCQAFENGRSLVELSEHSPHDITGVLKHFLKEVGTEPPPDHHAQPSTSLSPRPAG